MTVDQMLAVVTSLVTTAISWITSFVGAVTASPLLLLFVLTGFVGLGIGLIKRLIRL